MLKIKFNNGFTLIELMVVIVIIGILATLGLVSYRNAIIRSRDSRAVGGVKDIISALEQQKAADGINSYYTNIGSSAECSQVSIGTDFTVPDGNPNPYTCTATGLAGARTAYCISVLMENDKNGNCGGCTGGSTYDTSATTDFCARTKQ